MCVRAYMCDIESENLTNYYEMILQWHINVCICYARAIYDIDWKANVIPVRSISDSHSACASVEWLNQAAITYISLKPLIFASSAPLNLLAVYLRLFPYFFSFARHHTKFYLSGTFFRIRSPSCGIVFPLSLCVRSFEIIVYALLCLHLYLFICVWFFPFLVRAFILSFSFHFRFPFVIHVFDGFSHSKQHTSANTLNTLTFIVGVPRQPSNLFHYQWIFIEHQISTWHIIWFSYFPIFVLFFGLSAWDVRVCVCVNVFNVYMLWYRICEWESLHIYKFKR